MARTIYTAAMREADAKAKLAEANALMPEALGGDTSKLTPSRDSKLNKLNTNMTKIKSESEEIRKWAKVNVGGLKNKIAKKTKEIQRLKEIALQLEAEISKNKYGCSTFSIEGVLLNKALPKFEHSLVCLEVGDEDFLFITKQDVNNQINEILREAKSGNKKPVHLMLRKWGYTYNQKTLEVLGNEVLAIVAMHNQRNRSNASLVNEGHIEGDEFRLVKMTNEFSEEVFGVLVKELAVTHQDILANKDKQILLKNETDELLVNLNQVKGEQAERLADLKKTQGQIDSELKEIQDEVRIETQLKEESELWSAFLSERKLRRYYADSQSNQFCLDLGGLVEMKLPPASDEHTILVEKRMALLTKWTQNSDGDGDTASAFLLEFNEQLSNIEREYKQYNQTINTRKSNIKKLIVGSMLDDGSNGYYSSQIDVYDDFLQQFGKG